LLDAVRDVTFIRVGDVTSQAMTSSAMYADDELQCTAVGNPAPTYTLTTDLRLT